MFGQNPIRKQELRQDGRLWVQEVFRTIQGEGPLAGRPAVFVRLAGCNLACKFCDTEFESGAMQHELDVLYKVHELVPKAWRQPLVVLTGGEPLRQDVRELVRRLFYARCEVQIETAGTLWLDDLDRRAQLVVSPKTGSLHAAIYERATDFKYILRAGELDPDDGLPMFNPQTGVKQRVARPIYAEQRAWVQPCDDHDPAKNKENLEATKESALKFGYHLSLQQHKILELP
jgi:7-carboxy-7-deazaguanine synthase